jgi:hypothetical protein
MNNLELLKYKLFGIEPDYLVFEVTHEKWGDTEPGIGTRVVTSTYRRHDGTTYTKDQTVWRPNRQVDWVEVKPGK